MSFKKNTNKNTKGILKNEKEFKLKLFITGTSPNSVRAISNTKEFCETYLKDNYDLEIIDVYQEPALAEQQQIIALPVLLKSAPLPLKKLIGDMSDKEKMARGLGIEIK